MAGTGIAASSLKQRFRFRAGQVADAAFWLAQFAITGR